MSSNNGERRAGSWPRFANGRPYPRVCWPLGLYEAARGQKNGHAAMQSGLAIVAIGEHEGDVTHVLFDDAKPELVAQTLEEFARGQLTSDPTASETFQEAYERLRQASPGASEIDVLVIKLHDDNPVVAHLGSRGVSGLLEPLNSVRAELLAA